MTSLTLVFSEAESRVVEELAAFHELSKTQLMRQALRLYQSVHLKQQQGQQMAFIDKAGNVVHQAIIGMKGGA